MNLKVDIRPAVEDDLPALERHLGRGYPTKHRTRFALQAAGKAVYLVAWYGNIPIGHVLVEWEGAHEEPLASALRGCPILSDLYIVEPLQSRGIGSRLLDAAEDLAQHNGAHQLALGVAIDNPRARSLYQRRGYQDSGIGEYTSRWQEIDEHRRQHWFEERETCLVKSLPLPPNDGTSGECINR